MRELSYCDSDENLFHSCLNQWCRRIAVEGVEFHLENVRISMTTRVSSKRIKRNSVSTDLHVKSLKSSWTMFWPCRYDFMAIFACSLRSGRLNYEDADNHIYQPGGARLEV